MTAVVVVTQQVGWLGGQDGKGGGPAKPEATAVVERMSLSTGMDVKGTIGYGHETDKEMRGEGVRGLKRNLINLGYAGA